MRPASARRAQHAWSSGLLGDSPQLILQQMADVWLRPRAACRASAVQHSLVARPPAAGAGLARLNAKRRQGVLMLVTPYHLAVNGSPGLGNRLWLLLSVWCFGPPWLGTFAFERAADCLLYCGLLRQLPRAHDWFQAGHSPLRRGLPQAVVLVGSWEYQAQSSDDFVFVCVQCTLRLSVEGWHQPVRQKQASRQDGRPGRTSRHGGPRR